MAHAVHARTRQQCPDCTSVAIRYCSTVPVVQIDMHSNTILNRTRTAESACCRPSLGCRPSWQVRSWMEQMDRKLLAGLGAAAGGLLAALCLAGRRSHGPPRGAPLSGLPVDSSGVFVTGNTVGSAQPVPKFRTPGYVCVFVRSLSLRVNVTHAGGHHWRWFGHRPRHGGSLRQPRDECGARRHP